jgi:hypothetical protein
VEQEKRTIYSESLPFLSPSSIASFAASFYAIARTVEMSPHLADLLKCFCGSTYTNALDLEEHRRARGHFVSHVCRGSCKHPPAVLYDLVVRKCGCCGKLCERLDILEDHRIATGHCDISFTGIRMASCAHCKPLQQSSHRHTEKARKSTTAVAGDQACIRCQRTFPSFQSLQQHCESVKHKPLSALRCPTGEGCTRTFSAPSALLHHLESGKCCSTVDRDVIYDKVQLYDKDCSIHSLATPTSSSSPCSPPHRLSLDTETPTASLDHLDSWSLVTSTHTEGSAEDSLADWSPLKDSSFSLGKRDAVDEVEPEFCCPLCTRNRTVFATTQALRQHMISSAHRDKVYHCPSSLFRMHSSSFDAKRGKRKQFTSLSGLTQHLESGACHGGRQTFLHCIEFVQRHLEQWGVGGMRLLLPEFKA